jgi:hypothetical protein
MSEFGHTPSDARRVPQAALGFLHDFEAHTRYVSRRLHEFVERLPSGLRAAGARFQRAHGLTSETFAWPSIYFLLPFWVESDLGRPLDQASFQIAYANACLAYTVLLQDHVMDDDDVGPDLCLDLAAANAFLLEGILAYTLLFPVECPFWAQAAALMNSSWNALVLEKKEHAQPSLGMVERDKEIQQAKVNAGKVAALAVAMLAQREDTAPQLFRHLDHWQLGCQMMDDFLDFRSDLDRGNYTQFLVFAGVTHLDDQSEARVQEQLGNGALRNYFECVVDHYKVALRECPTRTGYLSRHIEYLMGSVERFGVHYDALLRIRLGEV